MNDLVLRNMMFPGQYQYPYQGGYGYQSYIPMVQTPEAVLAETRPKAAFKLLLVDIKSQAYNKSLEVASTMVNTYLGRSSVEGIDALTRVQIQPGTPIKRFFSSTKREMTIHFHKGGENGSSR